MKKNIGKKIKKKIRSKNKKGWYSQKIIRNILKETLDISAWVLLSLACTGKATTELFFKPSYYIKDPSEFLNNMNVFKNKNIKKASFYKSISRLQKYGLVEKSGKTFVLTEKGKNIVKRILGYKKSLNKKWDGKYRVVIFDIPEKKRFHRDWLRRELTFLQYEALQRSVFRGKFPLTVDIIKEIKRRDIDDGVNYILAERIYDIKKEREK